MDKINEETSIEWPTYIIKQHGTTGRKRGYCPCVFLIEVNSISTSILQGEKSFLPRLVNALKRSQEMSAETLVDIPRDSSGYSCWYLS